MNSRKCLLVSVLAIIFSTVFEVCVLEGAATRYQGFVIYCLSWLCICNMVKEDKL